MVGGGGGGGRSLINGRMTPSPQIEDKKVAFSEKFTRILHISLANKSFFYYHIFV